MRRTDPEEGRAALAAWARGERVSRPQLAAAVRWTLELFAADHPGGAVELRVPPFAAVQAIAGVRHTRGTPPAVVETDAQTWLALVAGDMTWDEARAGGLVSASGERSELGDLVPLPGPRRAARTAREGAADHVGAPENDEGRPPADPPQAPGSGAGAGEQ